MKRVILAFLLIVVIYAVFYMSSCNRENFIVKPENRKLIDMIGESNIQFIEYSAKIGRDGWNTDRYDLTLRNIDAVFKVIPVGMYKEFDDIVISHGSSVEDFIIGFERTLDNRIIVKLYTENKRKNDTGNLVDITAIGVEFEVDDIPVNRYRMISEKKYSKMDRNKNFDFEILRNLISSNEFDMIVPLISDFRHVAKKVKDDKESYYFQLKNRDVKVDEIKGFLISFNREIVDTEWYGEAKDKRINWLAFERGGDKVSFTVYFMN